MSKSTGPKIAMTDNAFEALARLVRSREGPTREAAKLVLVHGHRPSAAARECGTSLSSVSNAVYRLKKGLELARQAVG